MSNMLPLYIDALEIIMEEKPNAVLQTEALSQVHSRSAYDKHEALKQADIKLAIAIAAKRLQQARLLSNGELRSSSMSKINMSRSRRTKKTR